MLTILRRFWWMLKTREGRLDLAYALIREWPDAFGSPARVRLLRRHFAAVGPRLAILEGARFRNVAEDQPGRQREHRHRLHAAGRRRAQHRRPHPAGAGLQDLDAEPRVDDPDRPVAEQGATYAAVSIGRDCWIGAASFIMPGVSCPRAASLPPDRWWASRITPRSPS